MPQCSGSRSRPTRPSRRASPSSRSGATFSGMTVQTCSRSPAAVQLAHADVSDDEQGHARRVGQMGPAAPFALDSGPASSQVARGQRAGHDSRRPPQLGGLSRRRRPPSGVSLGASGIWQHGAGSVPHRRPPPHELRRSPLRVPRRNYCTSRVLRPRAAATTIASQPRFGTGAVGFFCATMGT